MKRIKYILAAALVAVSFAVGTAAPAAHAGRTPRGGLTSIGGP
jgi:hypothetical protein